MGAIIGLILLALCFVAIIYEIGYCNGYEACKGESDEEKTN